MFTLRYEPADRLLIAELEGFWTTDVVSDYKAAAFDLMRRSGVAKSSFRMLANSDRMAVQSQAVSAAFSDFTRDLAQMCLGPIAITAATTLNKVQASRALAHPRIRVFLDREQALHWLMSVPLEPVR
jgi:hypothetical protein